MQFDKIYVLWLKIAKFLKRKKKKEMCAFDVRELIVCMCMCVLTIIKQWSSQFGKSFIELHLKSQWFWILWIATHCECMRRSWNKWAAISILQENRGQRMTKENNKNWMTKFKEKCHCRCWWWFYSAVYSSYFS